MRVCQFPLYACGVYLFIAGLLVFSFSSSVKKICPAVYAVPIRKSVARWVRKLEHSSMAHSARRGLISILRAPQRSGPAGFSGQRSQTEGPVSDFNYVWLRGESVNSKICISRLWCQTDAEAMLSANSRPWEYMIITGRRILILTVSTDTLLTHSPRDA